MTGSNTDRVDRADTVYRVDTEQSAKQRFRAFFVLGRGYVIFVNDSKQ